MGHVKRLSHLVTRDLPLRMTIDMLPTGVMHDYGDWHIYHRCSRSSDGTLEDIMVLQPQDDGRATTFYADTAIVETGGTGSRIVMSNGHFIPESDSGEARHVTFESLTKSIPRYNPRNPLSAPRGMTIGELLRAEEELEERFIETNALPLLAELRTYRVEIGDRFGLPLMCFAAALLGAPMAARIPRAGRSFAFATGVGVIALYFILYGVAKPQFPPSLPTAILLAQVPNLVLVALGSVVLWRVDRV